MEEGSLRCDANVACRLSGADEVRHQGGSEEREQLPVYSRGAGVRDRAADGGDRVGGRVTQETRCGMPRRADVFVAVEGGGARLSVFSGAGSAAAAGVATRGREILTAMPELPEARRARMIEEYEISEQDAQTLTATREFAERLRRQRSRRRIRDAWRTWCRAS